MTEIPLYQPAQKPKEDPVARSMAKRDACAKPCSMSKGGVRVRVNMGKSDVKIRKKRRNWDKRDVTFY